MTTRSVARPRSRLAPLVPFSDSDRLSHAEALQSRGLRDRSKWGYCWEPLQTLDTSSAPPSVGVGPSRPARDNVTVHLSPEANENDAVTRGISFVPFQLVIGHGYFCPVRNYALAVRNDGYVVVLVNLE
jgi:hypothetical protein